MKDMNEAFSKAGLDAWKQLNKVAELALESSEKLFNLNWDFTKKSFDFNSKAIASLLQNTNPQNAGKEAGEWATQNGEQITQHLQSLCAWAETVQQNTQKLAETQLFSLQDSIKKQLQEMKKAAPEQTHAWFDQMQQAFDATQNTLSSLQNTAKEVQKSVTASVKQSQKAAEDAVKAAAKKAEKR